MDGQVSPAAEAANRRLYELRAALAARRASDGANSSSHSDLLASLTAPCPMHDSAPVAAGKGAESAAGERGLPGVSPLPVRRPWSEQAGAWPERDNAAATSFSKPGSVGRTVPPVQPLAGLDGPKGLTHRQEAAAEVDHAAGWGGVGWASHSDGTSLQASLLAPLHACPPVSPLPTSAAALRALLAALPPHLGWGSETLTRHLRAIRYGEQVRGPEPVPLASDPGPLEPPNATRDTRHASLVKVHPDLALAMLRTERAAAGRVWLLLRALDAPGRGMVAVADARAALTEKGSPLRLCGWRRLRQLLAEGDGVFWAREGLRLRLFGPARVAAALGVARLGNRPVAVPAAALLGSIGDARAQLYAAFHSGRARLVTNQVPGSRGQVPGKRSLPLEPGTWPLEPSAGMPISRDTLAVLSGACPRSQAAYERRAGVASRGNFALGERVPGRAGAPPGDAEQERAWRQGRALFRLTDYHGQQGAPGATYLAWRLPNTYGPARGHQQQPKGRQKRINRQLADLFMKGMTGNGGRPIEKRFYAGAAAAYRRAERLVDEGTTAHQPHNLHWPDGRTRGGAGVWRVVAAIR